MGIFSRTRDIIAANVTDLLDKAEDPAKMIRMIIMEMQETLVEVRAGAARTIADQKEMRRHISKLEALQESWTEKAQLALSKDREDLAKAALVEARARQNSLATRMESAETRLKVREMYAGEKVQDAFARFDILEQRVDFAEGRADAMNLGGTPPTLEEEIAALKSNDKIDAELAAMKAAQQNASGTGEG